MKNTTCPSCGASGRGKSRFLELLVCTNPRCRTEFWAIQPRCQHPSCSSWADVDDTGSSEGELVYCSFHARNLGLSDNNTRDENNESTTATSEDHRDHHEPKRPRRRSATQQSDTPPTTDQEDSTACPRCGARSDMTTDYHGVAVCWCPSCEKEHYYVQHRPAEPDEDLDHVDAADDDKDSDDEDTENEGNEEQTEDDIRW